MGRKTREKEIATDINVKSSDAGINIKSSDVLIYNYKNAVTVKDELSELKDKIAAIEGDRQPSSKRHRKISVKVYV